MLLQGTAKYEALQHQIHNPAKYNGYKAYWSDGCQLIPPHDNNVIDEVNKIKSIDDVKWKGNPENITL